MRDKPARLQTARQLARFHQSESVLTLISGEAGVGGGRAPRNAFSRPGPSRSGCEIYGAPDAVVAGTLRPTGRARPVDGGFVVDGRWSFASGIRHAAWWNAGCLVGRDGAGDADTQAPEAWLVFSPAPDGELIDNWDVGGLRGTGSPAADQSSVRW